MPQRSIMSYEELSTIIHFAPMSLVVLDRNRNLSRVNRMAESLLGLDPRFCTGQSLLNWVPDISQNVVTRVLNLSAESAWSQAPSLRPDSRPTQTTISLHTRRSEHDAPGKTFWADISCSVYYEDPKAPLHEGSYILTIVPYNNRGAKSLDRLREPSSSSDEAMVLRSPASSASSAVSSGASASLKSSSSQSEEDIATAAAPSTVLTPSTTTDDDDDDHSSQHTAAPDARAADALLRGIVYGFDFPVIAMSKDGRTIARNDAMDKTLLNMCHNEFEEDRPWGEKGSMTTEEMSEKAVDVSWLFSHFRLYDTAFVHEMPDSAYPLYRAAILGERFKHTRFGATVGASGRRIIEAEGWPIYADEGKGEFIGGVIVLHDVTRVSARDMGMQEMSVFASAAASAGAPPSGPQLPSTVAPPVSTNADLTEDDPAHAYYRNLCQELPDIAWIARGDGYLEWYNRRWYEYTGQTADEAVGAGWTSCVHEEDFPAVSKTWSTALRTSTRYEVQERIRGADGEYRWMLCRAHPFCDADGKVIKWFGYLTDIHQTLETLAANRESKEHLTEAVRVADITLWSIDTQGIFTLAEGNLSGVDPNTSNTSLTGSQTSDDGRGDKDKEHHIRMLPPAQAPIVGKSIYTEWGETTRRAIERALAGEVVVEETTIKGRTYRTHYKTRRARMSSPTSFLLSDRMAPEDAPIVGVTGMSMDITERLDLEKKMAEGIREVARAEAAEAAATEASRMKSQFLAVISHEIRTPLNGVVGLSELLLDIETLPPEASDLVNSILRSAGALLTVINDVLDFSKIEAGRLDLVSLPFSLRLTCEDSVRDFKRLMAQKGLKLVKEIDLPGEELVMGDAGRITQVLNNLLGNAGKFTSEGSVSLHACKTTTSPSPTGHHHYTFTVSDTGCGVPAEKLSLLFQPFRQADPSTSRRYGGSGLGLAICKNLIELMGGKIWLRSEEGKGTTVSFTIPFRPVDGVGAGGGAGVGVGVTTGMANLGMTTGSTPTYNDLAAFKLTDVDTAAGGAPGSDMERRISTTTMSGPDFQGLSLRRSSIVDVSHLGGGSTAAGGSASSSSSPPRASTSSAGLAAMPESASGLASASTSASMSTAPDGTAPSPARRPRILLAEDNPINSQIAIKTLSKLGYDVDHVENGSLVLLALSTQPASTYDLVLMDCMMPTMDGYQATRKMRASSDGVNGERMRRIPVIALTAAAIQGQKTCFAAGMTDYLSKPVRRATLGAMLVKWLGKEHPQNANGLPCMLEDRAAGLVGGMGMGMGMGMESGSAAVPSIEVRRGSGMVTMSSSSSLSSLTGGMTTTTTTTSTTAAGITTTVVTSAPIGGM